MVVNATDGFSAAPFSQATAEVLEARRYLTHFHAQYGGALSQADMADLVKTIKAAEEAGQPEMLTQYLRGRMVEFNDAFRQMVDGATHVRRADGTADMAFEAVSNVMKIGNDGQILGIKCNAELQEAFTAFRARHAADAGGLTGKALADHLDQVAGIDKFIAFLKTRHVTVTASVGTAGSVRTFPSNIDGGNLKRNYEQWVRRQAGVGSLSDVKAQHFADFKPEAYVVCVQRGGRPRAALDAIVGPKVMDAITRTAPRQSSGARGFQVFIRAEKGLDEVLGPGWRGIHGGLENARKALQVQHGTKIADGAAEWTNALDNAWTARFPWDSEIPVEVKEWIERGLCHLTDPTAHAQTLGQSQRASLFQRTLKGEHADIAMGRLMGHQIIDLDELAHRMLDARDLLENAMAHTPNGRMANGVFPYVSQAQFDVMGKFITRSGSGPQEYLFEAVRAMERNAELAQTGASGTKLSFGADLPRIDAPDRFAEGWDEVEFRPRKAQDPTPVGENFVATRERKSVKYVLAYSGRADDSGALTSMGKAQHQFGQQLRRTIMGSGEDIPQGGFPKLSARDQATDLLEEGRHGLGHVVEFDGLRIDRRFEDAGGVPEEALGTGAVAPTDAMKTDLIARAEAAFDATNALLSDTRRLPDAPGMLDQIADMAGAGSGKGDALRAAASTADPPLMVKELFLLRSMLHSSETTVPDSLLAQVRAIANAPVHPRVTPEFIDKKLILLSEKPLPEQIDFGSLGPDGG